MTYDIERRSAVRTRWVATGAAALAGIVLVLAGFAIGRAGGSGSPEPTGVPATASTPAPAAADPAAEPSAAEPSTPASVAESSGPDPGGADTGAGGVDLADLTWTDLAGVELPGSATHGPANGFAGLVSGFSRTPTGALLAAININHRTGASLGPDIYRPTIRDQVVGPYAADLLGRTETAYAEARALAGTPPGAPTGPGEIIVLAYRLDLFTPDGAVVAIVHAAQGAPEGTRIAFPVEVTWVDGDWHLVAADGAPADPRIRRIPSLDGYTILPGR